MKTKLIISCEHASNSLPEAYMKLFKEHAALMDTHLAYDIGSAKIFEQFKNSASVDFSLSGNYSRLLIELNRSLKNKSLFSFISQQLTASEKQAVIENIYLTYRTKIEEVITNYIKQKFTVIHLSVHSFTPVLNGIERTADIGLLYDPKRLQEKKICKQWKNNLKEINPNLKVRMNYPYLGTADGFTTHLRKLFPEHYAGIELEVNNKMSNSENWPTIIDQLIESFEKSC